MADKIQYSVEALNCPGCGAPIDLSADKCEYCDRPLIVRSVRSLWDLSPDNFRKEKEFYDSALKEKKDMPELYMASAFYYLKLKLYDKALEYFNKALDSNTEACLSNPDIFYYTAIAMLQGKKAFVTPRPVIDKALEYLDAANRLEPKGIYYYFMAYIKFDYHERKFLKTTPNYKECLAKAAQLKASVADINEMYTLLGVERPAKL